MGRKQVDESDVGGLFANGQRVPLQGVSIRVQARGVASRVTVAQRFRNDERVPVEAVYTFPLPESAAVGGFEVEIDGRRLAGRVVEREKAFEEYDDAMGRGAGAYLLDQDRPNVFTASVGNLLPGQEVVLRISYVSELEQSGSRMRLLIPTTVSPRYVPRHQQGTIDPSELDHLAPPIGATVPYGLDLAVDLEAASDVAEVECPSHPARVRVQGRVVHVELSGQDVQLDRDFVLDVALARPHEAAAVVSRDALGDRYVQLTWFPDLSSAGRAPADYVFVLDRSGSMDGTSIESARKALLLAMRSLGEGDRFDVVGFGSSFERVFGKLVAYDDDTLQRATRTVTGWGADLGGTELLAVLQAVLSGDGGNGRVRQVLLLTDGEVSDEADCIAAARRAGGHARVFTLGIGEGVSEYLVRGLARASGGLAEFLHPRERIEPAVMRQVTRMSRPALREVAIDWGELRVDDVTPAQPGPVFDGDRMTVYARITGGRAGAVSLRATGPTGPVSLAVPVDPERAVEDESVPQLMGRAAIRGLEEAPEDAGSRQAGRREKARRQRLVDLACRHSLLCSATSLVVIEEREGAKDLGPAELRRIPVALTAGWGGGQALPAAHATLFRTAGFAQQGFADACMAPPAPCAPAPAGRFAEAECRECAPDPFMDLVVAQRANGSWGLTAALANALGVPSTTLEALSGELTGVSRTAAKGIVATLAALQVLSRDWADRESEWRMLARKAEAWLAGEKAAAPGGESLEAWFTKRLGLANRA